MFSFHLQVKGRQKPNLWRNSEEKCGHHFKIFTSNCKKSGINYETEGKVNEL
jgi:hypothetical protein